MRPIEDVELVLGLAAQGLTGISIARKTAIPQPTVSKWIRRGISIERRRSAQHDPNTCDLRPPLSSPNAASYSYLLGLYLGDGHISLGKRDVYRLIIACDRGYPGIIAACVDAIASLVPNRVGLVPEGDSQCTRVSAYSKHWPCIFPQHGPGRKHDRPIVLEAWQQSIVDLYPQHLIRGLIHSDGCRVINRVKGYEYVRYMFLNRSLDIQQIFKHACPALDINCRNNNWFSVSIARRRDVEKLEAFVGPKR